MPTICTVKTQVTCDGGTYTESNESRNFFYSHFRYDLSSSVNRRYSLLKQT